MRLSLVLVLSLVAAAADAGEQILALDGAVADDGARFLTIPFEVPSGIAEIEVRHDDLSAANILDWGLNDPQGFRGWGGGNEEPAVVGVQAASRSYLPGPLPAGTWQVVVGKAKITELPARYHVEVVLRESATLAPQRERTRYQAAAALVTGARWYAGDFHVHSRESGDARPALDEIAGFARGRALDFVVLTDHNTVSQHDFIVDAQGRHPELLLIPGIEWTTYAGHANAVGATSWVDHKIGFGGATLEAAARALATQSAVVSINHPTFELGTSCIGCAWKMIVPPEVSAIEIATGGYRQTGFLFTPSAIALWDELLDEGRHLAALGGSDDHRAGQDLSSTQSPIGSPTTLVYATALDAASILAGVRRGRTVVKLQDSADPMVELLAGDARIGDTVSVRTSVTLEARMSGGVGGQLVLLRNGAVAQAVDVTAEPFVYRWAAAAPTTRAGVDRWRAEVWMGGVPRTVTSHLYLASDAGAASGCSVSGGATSQLVVALSALLGLMAACRRRPR